MLLLNKFILGLHNQNKTINLRRFDLDQKKMSYQLSSVMQASVESCAGVHIRRKIIRRRIRCDDHSALLNLIMIC